jgi:hypothetical protein
MIARCMVVGANLTETRLPRTGLPRAKSKLSLYVFTSVRRVTYSIATHLTTSSLAILGARLLLLSSRSPQVRSKMSTNLSNPITVFLFGDQAYDFVPSLRELLKTNNNPILSAFLDQAHYVLRAQAIKSLPPGLHKACRTTSLAQLLRKHEQGTLPASFTTPLFCLAQLGCFMRYVFVQLLFSIHY